MRLCGVFVIAVLATGCSVPGGPSIVREETGNRIPDSAEPDGTMPVVFGALGTATSTMTASTDGWASVTGFRTTETRLQKEIARHAMTADGESSGQETLGDWDTDADNGEGERMRNAINLLATFMAGRPSANIALDGRIEQQMKAQLSTFDVRRQQLLVDRMVDRWRFWSRRTGPNPFQFPLRDDRHVLVFMGFNRQCLEWANTIAISAGGRSARWLSPGVSLYAVRPGMGLFDAGHHAMIIVDIDWRGGVPSRFRVAEANWGDEWMHPAGQIPWQRTVITSRIVSAGVKVVSFE